MSIKKFYEQSGEEPMNIHDIRIDTKKEKEKFEFDPESKITDFEWLEIKNNLSSFREGGFWLDFCNMALWMQTLFPNRASQLKLDDDAWQALNRELANRRERYWEIKKLRIKVGIGIDEAEDFFSLKAKMKMLFPERTVEIKLDDATDDEEIQFKMMNIILLKYRRIEVWNVFAQRAIDTKILLSPKAFKSMVNDDDWRRMKAVLKESRHQGNWYIYTDLAAEMKLLFPERAAELGIDGVTWRKMKQNFEENRNGNVGAFLLRAFALKILAAHKVELTEKGLEITMDDPAEDFREKREPRPVRLSLRGV